MAWLLDERVVSAVKHVLNVLGLVLRLLACKLVLVGELNRTCPIEELGGTVSRHILNLRSAIREVLILATAYAAVTQAWLTRAVCEHFTVKEGQIIWACPCEALVV